jgi:hypothetical protein
MGASAPYGGAGEDFPNSGWDRRRRNPPSRPRMNAQGQVAERDRFLGLEGFASGGNVQNTDITWYAACVASRYQCVRARWSGARGRPDGALHESSTPFD